MFVSVEVNVGPKSVTAAFTNIPDIASNKSDNYMVKFTISPSKPKAWIIFFLQNLFIHPFPKTYLQTDPDVRPAKLVIKALENIKTTRNST